MDAQDVPLPLLVSWSSPVEVDSLVMGRRPQEWRCGVQATHQSAAVVGIAVVAMGEELGKDMSGRAMEHLLQYGDPFVRRGPACVLRRRCRRRLTKVPRSHAAAVRTTARPNSNAGVAPVCLHRTEPSSVCHRMWARLPVLHIGSCAHRHAGFVEYFAGGRCRWRWRC